VIEVPPLGHPDAELMLDSKFYARFLALYASKMKKDWVRIDMNYEGNRLKEARNNYTVILERKIDKEDRKRKKILKEPQEYYVLGYEVKTAC
jgi:hypothetical protein